MAENRDLSTCARQPGSLPKPRWSKLLTVAILALQSTRHSAPPMPPLVREHTCSFQP